MDAAAEVTRIAGIGRTFASRLRARGITSVGELRSRLATADLRRVFAWETGISARKLETWHRLATVEVAPEAAPASPEGPVVRAQDGLSGAESDALSSRPIDADAGAEAAPHADPAEPAPLEPVLHPAPAPIDLAPVVDDALVQTPDPVVPRIELPPVDATALLRSVGRLRTVALAVFAAALVTLATAISMSLSRGERPALKDPLLSVGASSAARLERANHLFRDGRFEAAEIEYRLTLALDPDSEEAQVNLGRALYRQLEFADAVEELRKAIDKKETAAAHYYLSGALLGLGDAAEALTAARRAIALEPSFDWSYYNLALAWAAIPDAPALSAVEHRSAVRALLADLESAEGDGLDRTIRLLERLTGHRETAGTEALPGATPSVRDAWRLWGRREGLSASASPQPGDAVGESR